MHNNKITGQLKELLRSYLSPEFNKSIRAYILSLPQIKLPAILYTTEDVMLNGDIPSHIALMMVNDIVAFRNRVNAYRCFEKAWFS